MNATEPMLGRSEKFVTASGAPIGRLGDGTLYFAPLGLLSYDIGEDRVQCHLCGGWFRHVGGSHLRRRHGWTLAQYRDAFQLLKTKPTCVRSTSEKSRAAAVRRIDAGELVTGKLTDPVLGDRARGNRRLAGWRTLAAKHPELLVEVHPTRNGDLDPDAVAAGSNRKVWWRCESCGHEWRTRVCTRTAGAGCPVCSRARAAETQRGRSVNNLVSAERSLAVKHPELVAELHRSRNSDLDPYTLGAGSSQKVWWRCPRGHEWEATVGNRSHGVGCPVCAGERNRQHLEALNRVPRERSLAVKHPELVGELHPAANGDVDPYALAAGSERKLWWRCGACGHDRQAAAGHRSAGSGCPVCARDRTRRALTGRLHPRPVKPQQSLAVRHPELVAELHPTRNAGLEPSALSFGSRRKVWWRCPLGHEWQAAVGSRSRGRGCPDCAHQRPVAPHRRLAVKHPELIAELHPTRNTDLDPDTLAAGSRQKVWWRCARGHEWQATVGGRSDGRGCPVCFADRRVSPGRTLAVKHPELLAELHSSRNGDLDPGKLGASSHRQLWWRCASGHEWQASAASRCGGTGCPHCYRASTVPEPDR